MWFPKHHFLYFNHNHQGTFITYGFMAILLASILAQSLFYEVLNSKWEYGSLWYDSYTYMIMYDTRPALYPIFLQLYKAVFGFEFFLPLTIMQTALGLTAIILLVQTLFSRFHIKRNTAFIIFFLLFSPYSFLTMQELIISYHVASEAIAYPFFLLFIRSMLLVLLDHSKKHTYYMLIFIFILVLARRQFLFVYPFLFIFFTYLSFRLTDFSKLQLLGALVLTIFVTDLAERSYHNVVRDQFIVTPSTGLQLVIAPLYLATAEDEALFDTPQKKKIFRETYARMQKFGLSFAPLPPDFSNIPIDNYPFFLASKNFEKDGIAKKDVAFTQKYRSDATNLNSDDSPSFNFYTFYAYNNILWNAIMTVLQGNGIDNWVDYDHITTDMALTWIKAHPDKFLVFYLENVVQGFGGIIGITLVLSIFIYATLYLIRHHAKHDNKTTRLLIVWCLILLAIGNVTATALVEPVMPRYTFYTHFLLLSIVPILLKPYLPAFSRRPPSVANPET